MKLESIFGNGMVLQRNKPVYVFGTGSGHAKVTLAGNTAEADGKDGKWCVTLPALPEGGPLTLTAELDGVTAKIHDIMVGEVYILSGQSNMEMPLFRTSCGFDTAAGMADKEVRYFTLPRRFIDGKPVANRHFEVLYGKDTPWEYATEESSLHFSAIGAYFARELRRALGVPVGMISAPWGGRPIRTFIPRDSFDTEPALAADLERFNEACRKYSPEEYGKLFDEYISDLARFCADTSGSFENTREYSHHFAYARDGAERPVKPAPYGAFSIDRPGGIWETMISHICPYSARGVLWYQGETGCDDMDYFGKYAVLLSSWRDKFRDAALPFLAVELAPFLRVSRFAEQSDVKGFAFLREQQQKAARELKNNWLATILDAGDKYDIHPQDKKTPAHRLFLLAMRHIYGRTDIVADAPEYASHEFQPDGAAHIRVKNANKLYCWGGAREFMIAGEDGVFFPARAVLLNHELIRIRSDRVTAPAYIRYAFCDYPEAGNIFSEAGLPLRPFRTDALTNATHRTEL